MRRLSTTREPDVANAFFTMITTYRTWEQDGTPWPNRFMMDTEWTWMNDAAAIDDV